MSYSTISSFRGYPFKLRTERGRNFFLNILKTKKNSLSICEAKILVWTFCISWYQQNENWIRNKGFQGTESVKFWCFLSLKQKNFGKHYITWIAWNVTLNNMPFSNFVLCCPLRNSGDDPYNSTSSLSWKLKINLLYIDYNCLIYLLLYDFCSISKKKKYNCLILVIYCEHWPIE